MGEAQINFSLQHKFWRIGQWSYCTHSNSLPELVQQIAIIPMPILQFVESM